MLPKLLAAIQCVRRWRRAGLGGDGKVDNTAITDEEIDLIYSLCEWVGDDEV